MITIIAGADGIQSTNVNEAEKGFVVIEGGTLIITAGLDGVQAETNLLVSGGMLDIVTGGGSVSSTSGGFGGRGMEGNANQTEESVKGLKAGVDLTISGGAISISALDDALHSNATLTINGGEIVAASGDDGVHAEISLTINGGTLNITEAYEGLESQVITINDGSAHIVSSDDGLNATTGAGGGQVDGSYFYLNGGSVFLDTSGDGLDSNGTAIMNGGVVVIQGPVLQNNGPLDVYGKFIVNRGFLIVSGSSGMPETPSTTSDQNSIAVVFDLTQPSGTIVHIESLDGEEILTYESPKEFQLFVFSSPELELNTTYSVYVGGETSGTITNGVYSDGTTYASGTLVANLEISSVLTTLGNFESVGPGGGQPGGERPGRP